MRGRAQRLLGRREHSRFELGRKLTGNVDAVPPEVERLLDGLEAAGLLSDQRFAADLARVRAGAGYGPARIRAELESHGLPDAMVNSVLDSVEVNWHTQARSLWRKRFGDEGPSGHHARMTGAKFLERRGFYHEHIRALTGGEDCEGI